MLLIMAKRYSLQLTRWGREKNEHLQRGPHCSDIQTLEKYSSTASVWVTALQTALALRFFPHPSIPTSLLCPVPTGLWPQIDEINPPADESLMCSPSHRYLQRQQRLLESPKPSRSAVKHNRFRGEGDIWGLKSFLVPIKSLPIGVCLISNISLHRLSLVFYILREKGRIVTNCDVSSRIRIHFPIPSRKERGRTKTKTNLPLVYFQSASQFECAKQTDHPQTSTNNNHLFF